MNAKTKTKMPRDTQITDDNRFYRKAPCLVDSSKSYLTLFMFRSHLSWVDFGMTRHYLPNNTMLPPTTSIDVINRPY